MNKENKENKEEEKPTLLTPQQRALISQKYKAAKSLLSLHSHSSTPSKRPRFHHSSPPPLKPYKVDVLNSTLFCKGERTPLKDLQLNINSQVASKGCGLKNDKCYTTPLICNSVDKFCDSATKESNVQPKDDNLYTPINTQVKRFECFSTSNCSLLSSVLDDEFDESLLEEIDLLCERSSAKDSERKEDTEGDETRKSKTNTENNTDIYDKPESPQGIQDQNEQTRDIDVKQAKVFSDMPENYSNYMEKLNQDQLEAASTDASTPLIVVAGPGSGKTSTMVGRVLMLLNQGIGSSYILAMTFTTAAASEMRDRIGAVAGKEVSKELTISTFHSFSLQLCRSHADKLGRTSEFLIYGNGQQRRAVIEATRLLESEKSKQTLGACDTGGPTDNVKVVNFKERSQKWQKFVTHAKASGKTPEEFSRDGDELGATVLKNYNDILSSCNALDYHDLISCSVKLLSDYPEVFEECQKSWKAVIVDEFQDTSAMQYRFLKLLSSHGRITVVGDDDQSIFSFNGADISGFDSFRRDFPIHKEVRLKKNYRSTRCIVEAASSLIKHNIKRCQMKQVLTDNSSGSKITVKECRSEDAQCAYVVDKILETVSDSSETDCSFGNIAILYRRQITGRCFQIAFRERKIPFNVHGVAFYRKKVIKAIMALLRTTLPSCDDGPFRQVFKTFLPYEKEEKKRVLDHIEKVSTIRKCSFISAASDIFNAKISGTFNRSQLSQGRKVLITLDMISKLVHKEQSISSVITSAGNLLPQKYLLEKRAVIDCDGGKLLNEDHDLRSVLQYLLDDVNDFLTSQYARESYSTDDGAEKKGCIMVVKAFVDYISEREKENFRSRRNDNENSVTLTTIHQSKGLEWDIVFIVKANESEIPLLHEHNGIVSQSRNSLEEERRLLYVAMTRARKKLYILYVKMDSNWQVLHPSRFLREIPTQLIEVQGDMNLVESKVSPPISKPEDADLEEAVEGNNSSVIKNEESFDLENIDAWNRNSFLKRFNVDDRAFVSRIFHQWAKKKAFQDPKRLLDKVRFVIDERLRLKKDKKDILATLKSSLQSIEAFQFAEYVIKWDQIPSDERAHMTREKQEHFQKFRMENAMNTSAPTSKQLGYLRNLGCTVTPNSRLHASRLIEQYKSLNSP